MHYALQRPANESPEDFTARAYYADVWIARLAIRRRDGTFQPIRRTNGRGAIETGQMVWLADVDAPPEGPVQCRWDLPAVQQRIDFDFVFEQVQVPK